MFGSMAQSWEEIIKVLGDTGSVAEALSQSMSTVSGWKTRGIPAPHWEGIARLASERGCSDVTLDALAALAARKLENSEEVRA